MRFDRVVPAIAALALSLAVVVTADAAEPPMIGQKAPDFSLSSVDGKIVRLSDMTAHGTVVLIVLRGYPGYQCPFCNRQAHDFAQQAQAIAHRGAHVLMVYPGPGQDLNAHAREFLADKMFNGIEMVLDPDYKLTKAYGLRWNAPKETAYPATFLIDGQGTVFFLKIVREHGGRTTAAEVLDALPKAQSMQ
jgi:peroxiredoxin